MLIHVSFLYLNLQQANKKEQEQSAGSDQKLGEAVITAPRLTKTTLKQKEKIKSKNSN